MEDMQLQMCMRAKTMADGCHARINREYMMTILEQFGRYITIEREGQQLDYRQKLREKYQYHLVLL